MEGTEKCQRISGTHRRARNLARSCGSALNATQLQTAPHYVSNVRVVAQRSEWSEDPKVDPREHQTASAKCHQPLAVSADGVAKPG